MKIFQFDYEVDYGGGIMLVAAENEEEAIKIASREPTGFGHWVFAYEHTSLSYNGTPGVILEDSYAE